LTWRGIASRAAVLVIEIAAQTLPAALNGGPPFYGGIDLISVLISQGSLWEIPDPMDCPVCVTSAL
jgi:hypothetical protein